MSRTASGRPVRIRVRVRVRVRIRVGAVSGRPRQDPSIGNWTRDLSTADLL